MPIPDNVVEFDYISTYTDPELTWRGKDIGFVVTVSIIIGVQIIATILDCFKINSVNNNWVGVVRSLSILHSWKMFMNVQNRSIFEKFLSKSYFHP